MSNLRRHGSAAAERGLVRVAHRARTTPSPTCCPPYPPLHCITPSAGVMSGQGTQTSGTSLAAYPTSLSSSPAQGLPYAPAAVHASGVVSVHTGDGFDCCMVLMRIQVQAHASGHPGHVWLHAACPAAFLLSTRSGRQLSCLVHSRTAMALGMCRRRRMGWWCHASWVPTARASSCCLILPACRKLLARGCRTAWLSCSTASLCQARECSTFSRPAE